MRKKWQVSYGYPMGKLWVSYGAGRYLVGKSEKNTREDLCIWKKSSTFAC